MQDVKLVDISGTKRRNISKLKLMNWKLTLRSKISENRGINDFERGYQPRNNIVKYEKGALVTASHSILARCRNHISQMLKVHGVNEVQQTEKQAAEPLVPEPSAFEVEMTSEKLIRHKPPGIDQIAAELIKAVGRTICSEIQKLINSIWNPH